MTDRINPYGLNIKSGGKILWVGIPLRVHRRCLNPMFDIANNIAYDNMMVLSTFKPKAVNIEMQTSFINITGVVEGRHWVQEQGEVVVDLLLKEIEKAKQLPDVFVISPFTEISYNLRSLLFKPLIQKVKQYNSEIDADSMGDWLNSHIGTVHTFQGKQAEGVILCLGLDEKSKGAANWASSKPNLLNVALTRAKYRFVAIGDEKIWLNVPYFKDLKRLCVEEKVDV